VQCKAWELPESLLMAFPLQGSRTPRNGARMKAEGMRRGTPDMFLAAPSGQAWGSGPRNGLWIEMKSADGKQSPEQKAMAEVLKAQNYQYELCHSPEEAIQAISWYLNLA